MAEDTTQKFKIIAESEAHRPSAKRTGDQIGKDVSEGISRQLQAALRSVANAFPPIGSGSSFVPNFQAIKKVYGDFIRFREQGDLQSAKRLAIAFDEALRTGVKNGITAGGAKTQSLIQDFGKEAFVLDQIIKEQEAVEKKRAAASKANAQAAREEAKDRAATAQAERATITLEEKRQRLNDKRQAEEQQRTESIERITRGIARQAAFNEQVRKDPTLGISPVQESRSSIADIRAAQLRLRSISGNPFEVLSGLSGQLTGITPAKRNIEILSAEIAKSTQRAEAASKRFRQMKDDLRELRSIGEKPTKDQFLSFVSAARDIRAARNELRAIDDASRAAVARIDSAGFRGRAVADFFVGNILTGSLFTVGFTFAQAINENIINGAVTFGRLIGDSIAVAKDKAGELKDVLSGVAEDPEKIAAAIGITLKEARGFQQSFRLAESFRLQREFEIRGGAGVDPQIAFANDIKKILNVERQLEATEQLRSAGQVLIAAGVAIGAAGIAMRFRSGAGMPTVSLPGIFGFGGKGGAAGGGAAATGTGIVDQFGKPIASAPGNTGIIARLGANIAAPIAAAAAAASATTAGSKILAPASKAASGIGSVASKIGKSTVGINLAIGAFNLAQGQGVGETIIGIIGGIGGGIIGSGVGPAGTVAGSIGGSMVIGEIGRKIDTLGQPDPNDMAQVATGAAIVAITRTSLIKAGVTAGVAALLSQSPAVAEFVGENQAALEGADKSAIATLRQVAENQIAVQRIEIARGIEQVDFSRTRLSTEQVAVLSTILSKEEMITIQKRQQALQTRASTDAFRNYVSAQNEVIRLQNLGLALQSAGAGRSVDIGGFQPLQRLPQTGGFRGQIRIPQSVIDRNRLINQGISAQERLGQISAERMNIEMASRNEAARARNIQREERLQQLRDAISIAGVRQAGMTSFDVAANIAEAEAQAARERRSMAGEERMARIQDRIAAIALEEQQHQNTVAIVDATIKAETAQTEWADALTKERIAFSDVFKDARRETEMIWNMVTSAGSTIYAGIDGFASIIEAITGIELERVPTPTAPPANGGDRRPYLPYLTGEPTSLQTPMRNEPIVRGSNQTIVLQSAPVYIDGRIVGETVERMVTMNQSRRGAFGVS